MAIANRFLNLNWIHKHFSFLYFTHRHSSSNLRQDEAWLKLNYHLFNIKDKLEITKYAKSRRLIQSIGKHLNPIFTVLLQKMRYPKQDRNINKWDKAHWTCIMSNSYHTMLLGKNWLEKWFRKYIWNCHIWRLEIWIIYQLIYRSKETIVKVSHFWDIILSSISDIEVFIYNSNLLMKNNSSLCRVPKSWVHIK